MAWRGSGVLVALFAAGPLLAQDVLSILSDRCFACHGPDASHRMAGLRLDVDGGARAVSAKLLERISAADASKRMPPAYSGKPALTAREIAAIRVWIQAGAPMQKFWSFVPPTRPSGGSSIDDFLRARLKREGLAPSPEADRRLLIRRVSLDLTGIPPTPAEVDAFVNDRSAKAYEKVVDRLLASPRYGERMAFRWMEAARYGDTNGYQTDGNRDMWRWRDWVIDAFNRNVPYDRFTIEQLAGDLLLNATLDQKIATGFNRNHRTTGEGGIIPEEYRVEYVADRAQTTATVFLGLTAGCARCHDHKYDPISQKDFYRLFAYFNQIPNERGFVWNYGPEEPFVKAPLPDQQKRLAALDAALDRARRDWAAFQPQIHPPGPASDWTPTRDLVFGPEGPGQYDGDAAMFDYLQPFTYSASINPKSPTGAILTRLDDYMESQGHGLYLIDGKVRMHLTHRFTDLGWRVESAEPVKLNEWQQVAVTYDGKRLGSGVHIYIDGRPVAMKVLFDQNNEPFKKKNTPIRVGSGGGLKFDGAIRDARIYKRALSPEEALALAGNADAKARLAYLEATRPPALAALEKAQAERDALYERIPTVMVMADGAHRDTFVLKRGAYDAPGEKVTPGISAALHGPDCPDRLCLAQWIVSKSNPLTARVAVNRFWQSYFGVGIVKTVDDFGAQGERPAHPELLDWLAVEFMESGWDVKHMQKLIVMSAAYRQSSAATPALLEKDPDNRLIARGPRIRLGPEVIRDQALAVAGLLTEKIGGPSVKPYQPAGLWQELSGNNGYVQAKGPDLYRRSLYTFWKRTAPHPYMMNFDSPNREQCAVFENRTNSPLQALNLMNDVTFVEAARKLAERMMVEGGATAADRIAYGFDLLLAHRPDARRAQILQRAYDRFAADFRANPIAADKLLKSGDSPVRDGLDRADLAAYASVASLLLNMDEAITKE